MILGWLATYAAHSTLLLLIALPLARFLRSDAWREACLRTALFGGVLTTSLQLTTGFVPLTERLIPGRALLQYATATNASPSEDGGAPASVALSRFAVSDVVIDALLVAWLFVATVLLLRTVIQYARILHLLRDRSPLREGRAHELLASLRRAARVRHDIRLSVSHRCTTPLALWRYEICLPARFVADLSAEMQRTALAHELAHLVRRDSLWQLGGRVLESVFFFQPLNRLACRRLHDAAERRCDDWAVQQTGLALDLARCLTEVASWMLPGASQAGAIAMTGRDSSLVERVTRLAEWRTPADSSRAWHRALGVALLLATTTSAPSLAFSIASAAENDVSRRLPRPPAESASLSRAHDTSLVLPSPPTRRRRARSLQLLERPRAPTSAASVDVRRSGAENAEADRASAGASTAVPVPDPSVPPPPPPPPVPPEATLSTHLRY